MMETTDKVQIVLQFDEWNNVLGALGEAPFRISAPIIKKISDQMNAAISADRVAAPAVAQQDGADHAPH
jgi:hypothetical protein